ncbi:NADH-quinone oxidoreductase subunit L [Schinkia azotoformans]|nr:NADH-quinone oxidoreductase subunit L [Schinkia azotoformans]MEC1697416.1 NADH-quinone oxidoreductase subunit L [Schinkia azotoformans]MEC1714305.1 NADH-quinone oxidoreductase subunit L [Schinkia azotoformans]MEC1723435.1 NADH-quinone oxidoreductase subunit L [Schinkia azotoformans]MEC1741280.1 NADH-quinone oxidoreductase subunit L [Schinkia azotoformans]MEC1757143.1 NADH-quinone oxidoreductase subunit L [Schinkia azotoformans]
MMENAWLIPLFPLLSFVLLLLIGRRLKESSAYVGMLATLASLLLSIMVLLERLQGENVKIEGTWLTIGNTGLTAGFEVNQLNALMLFIVSLVSFLVHMYSKGYMHGDERMPVFYSYLGLFTFAMLSLVISPNLLQVYIFWELVGLGSFLLIGFYFFNPEARAAAKKAFIVTRIGDVGLFIGMILLFWQVGSFEYDEIFAAVDAGAIEPFWITLTAILIFVGAVGKSGQFPLHTWLPDAMEGPTPVSALIHAATMVAAGVYLVASLFPLFSASGAAMTVVATIGGITAIFAASIGLVQKDIKRVLAYSTVSQLGYMMLALGAAGYVSGVFHLMTHAFFKALLFLAAGSVIHAVHTQDIEEMGGLWKKMKLTAPLFLIGTLAISGFPLLSGFFSKDEILVAAWADGRYGLFWLAVGAAFFTAFYMFRLFFMVFTGESRGEHGDHAHESPGVMTFPMIVLGILAVVSGYVNTPWFGTFLGDWLTEGSHSLGHGHIEGPGWIMFVATGVSLAGILLAYLMYGAKVLSRDWLVKPFPVWYKVLYNKYYIDEIYHAIVVLGTRTIGLILQVFDTYIVGGLVKGTAALTQGIGRAGAKLQDGQVQTYGTVAFFGIAVLVVIIALTGGYLG